MTKVIIITLGSILIVVLSYYYKTNTTNTNKNIKKEKVKAMPNAANLFKNNKEVKVTVDQTKGLIQKDKGLLILDTRSRAEYMLGHIKGAILIPYNKIEMNLDELDGYEDKPILVYCRTGSRSAVAVDTLIENGFNKIYHMNQGYSKWK